MSKMSVFVAEGLEEVECLSAVDIARRGGVDVTMASVTGDLLVTGANGITLKADILFEDGDFSDSDFLFLPGGLPGVTNLASHKGLRELLKDFHSKGKAIGAICAAPGFLGELGLLEGKKATCYPGFETHMKGAKAVGDGVVTDGNITTGRGVGFAIDTGLEILRRLEGPEKAAEVKAAIQHPETV